MASAWNIVQGMAGLHGIAIPPTAFQRLGSLAGWLHHMGVAVGAADDKFFMLWEWILGLGALAFFAPNSLQLMARYEPALGVEPAMAYNIGPGLRLNWRASLGWGAAAAVIAAVGVLHTGGVSEFLYWQF
jgi:hypothetical protein